MSIKIAVIGSFKQYHQEIQQACNEFRSAGAQITSPVGNYLVEPGINFVRFTTDSKDWSDAAIQSLALHRILRADLTYVVAPQGYIGRTTCYEVGRIIEQKKPIYFSEQPLDLPIYIPNEFIINELALKEKIMNCDWSPVWLHASDENHASALERELASKNYRND